MSQTLGARARSLDFGRTLSDAIRAAGADPLGLAVVAALVLVAPAALLLWLNYANPRPDVIPGFNSVEMTVNGLASLVFNLMAYRVMVDRLRGQTTTYGQALSRSGGRFLILFAAGLLSGLSMILGMLLLIVPGVILALMWAVVGPVAVMERKGVFETLTRSADLTRYNRWMILGVWVVVIVVVFGAITVASLAWYAVVPDGYSAPVASAIVESVIGSVAVIATTALAAAFYHQLVEIKHGAASETVAEVFG